MVVIASNPSTLGAVAGLGVTGQAGLHSRNMALKQTNKQKSKKMMHIDMYFSVYK